MHFPPHSASWPRCARIAISVLLLGAFASVPAIGQAASREYDLKAAFLYNFATFGEWPRSCFPQASSPFVIGILGTDPFGPALEEIVAGERIKGRPIVIRRFDRPETAQLCQILFISVSEKRHLKGVLYLLQDRPVLTVADFPGFVEAGGSIEFTTTTRVGIQVNPAALRASKIVMSPKLLRLADVVATNSPPP